MMKLEVLNLALEAIELLRPIVIRIKKHGRNLARQITDAANSNVLNTGEGALSDPGTRRSRYQSAAGSANEARVSTSSLTERTAAGGSRPLDTRSRTSP